MHQGRHLCAACGFFAVEHLTRLAELSISERHGYRTSMGCCVITSMIAGRYEATGVGYRPVASSVPVFRRARWSIDYPFRYRIHSSDAVVCAKSPLAHTL
jgi:hypothetical protein